MIQARGFLKCRREFALNAFSLGNSEPLQVFVHRLLSLRRWYNVPTCIKRIPLQSCPFKFYKCKESSCRMSHVSGDERAQKEGGLWHVSFTAGEVQPNWFKPQLLKGGATASSVLGLSALLFMLSGFRHSVCQPTGDQGFGFSPSSFSGGQIFLVPISLGQGEGCSAQEYLSSAPVI